MVGVGANKLHVFQLRGYPGDFVPTMIPSYGLRDCVVNTDFCKEHLL